MGREQARKGTERRKRPRKGKRKSLASGKSTRSEKTAESPKKAKREQPRGREQVNEDACHHCAKDLRREEKALFVEEELGRIFCSEDCITAFFSPEIERLEEEFRDNLSKNDLTAAEREGFAYLRWITLQEPDEIWRQKTISGDYRYTLISEFQPATKPIWCVCICLFLRGEPSFLYLSFSSKNTALVNHYRRGERVEWAQTQTQGGEKANPGAPAEQSQAAPAEPEPLMDGLADAWTEDETYRAQMSRDRSPNDIPHDEFPLYQACLSETLEEPHEVWSLTMPDELETRLYHFIKHYPDEKPSGIWYIIVAKETEDEEEIEILDAFPTRDPEMVEGYRRGDQEVGTTEKAPAISRLVH